MRTWISKSFITAFLLVCSSNANVLADYKSEFQQGMTALDAKDYKSALDHYNKSINENPDVSLVHYFRACVYGHNREFERAIIDLTKSVELNPRFDLAV